MNFKAVNLKTESFRLFLIAISIMGLAAVYLFQESLTFSLTARLDLNANGEFTLKKTVRLLLNDTFMLILIHGIFMDRSVTRLAFWIQLLDTLVLLPIYIVVKLLLEGPSEISSPLLSQFHRLIVNPTLMMLIIPAVMFQVRKEQDHQ